MKNQTEKSELYLLKKDIEMFIEPVLFELSQRIEATPAQIKAYELAKRAIKKEIVK